MTLRAYIDAIDALFEARLSETDTPSGDVQGTMELGGIKYDQHRGLGQVPDNANIKYNGFACLMTPKQFLRLAAPRNFAADSNLQAIAAAIGDGNPIGSPFLDVDFSGDIAQVKSHEGRTRAEAIRRLAPNTLMLVHVFPRGGSRARHLRIEQIAAFRNNAIPEKTKSPIAGPHFAPSIWWLDGWKSL